MSPSDWSAQDQAGYADYKESIERFQERQRRMDAAAKRLRGPSTDQERVEYWYSAAMVAEAEVKRQARQLVVLRAAALVSAGMAIITVIGACL